MNRALPFFFLLALSAPAFGQNVDSQGAQQLSDNLSRYVGKQALSNGVLKVSVEGDAYKIIFDLTALAAKVPKQNLPKFDFAPYTLLVKPRSDGRWDVSADFSTSGSVVVNNPDGPRSAHIALKDGKFNAVYDPELAAFTTGVSSMGGLTMTSHMPRQVTDLSVGVGTSKLAASKSTSGGVDLDVTQAIADFVETVKIDNRAVGAIKTPAMVVNVTGKAIQTKPILDLLAFAVAHEDEAQLKADQAELKVLLRAALPLWQRIEASYTFKNFAVETYAGNFGAVQLSTALGADGIAENGKFDYSIKASGVTFPNIIPGWVAALLPTEFDLKLGGSNINLDSMTRKAIETFDLSKNPPLPPEFRDQAAADFMASTPKFIVDHSVFKNDGMEITLAGEMTFPGKKPDAKFTVDIAGYEKIIESFKVAARSDPEAAQYFPFVLAAQGFSKKLSDGRLEWVINAKPDGSVIVNGGVLKPADGDK